jgi:hypothetical protein
MEDARALIEEIKTPHNATHSWLILSLKGSALSVAASGDGNSTWSTGAAQLTEKFVTGYLYARVQADDKESVRYKFILVQWCVRKAIDFL